MKNLSKSLLALLVFCLLLTSCSEDEEPAPVEEEIVAEDPITILGLWSFTESSVEVLKIPEDSEINISAPNVNDLTWTFDTENILVQSPDTSWTESYNYDSVLMELQFNDGVYEVEKLTRDSLNLRIYVELTGLDIEFYTYFQLIK